MTTKKNGAAQMPLPTSEHRIPVGSKGMRQTSGGKWIELTIGVKPAKPLPDLSALDNKLPAERKYMTREQLAREYGSDPKAVQAIESFAKEHGLVVTRNEPASARMGLAGTADNVNAAFGVTLMDYENPKLGAFHARTGPVNVPREVADAITGVFGLNNHRILHRGFRAAHHLAPQMATPNRSWFIPTELAPVYNFPNANAQQQCIGLLEFGGGVETSDVAAYFSKIGSSAPSVQVVAVEGVSTDPASDPDSTGEVMLDVDVAGALGAGAKLAVYFSTFDEKGLVDCLSKVINDSTNDPSVVSISWGWDENESFNNEGVIWSAAAIQHCNQSFLAAAQLGITVCVSTGDDGSEAQMNDGRAHVNFPATSPYVLAVGGTSLHVRKSAKGRLAHQRDCVERRVERRRNRGRRQRRHGLPGVAARKSAAVHQPRPFRRARHPGRRRGRRPSHRLPHHVPRQDADRRRHQRVGAALGELNRPDQCIAGSPRGQLQRAPLFQIWPEWSAQGHHLGKQRRRRAASRTISGWGWLGRLHRLGCSRRPETACDVQGRWQRPWARLQQGSHPDLSLKTGQGRGMPSPSTLNLNH
jgi:hypothetical protein